MIHLEQPPSNVSPEVSAYLMRMFRQINIEITRLEPLLNQAAEISKLIGEPEVIHRHKTIADWLHKLQFAVDHLNTTVTPPAPALPVSEGVLLVDNYSNGFVRVRLNQSDWPDLTLYDGADHIVTFELAVASNIGPGGAVIASTAALFTMNTGAVWFDRNGTLGKLLGPGNTDIGSRSLTNRINVHDLCTVAFDMDKNLILKSHVTPP